MQRKTTSIQATMVTPREGIQTMPNDWITVELVNPWYLRWLPSARLRLNVDEAGRLHVVDIRAVTQRRA